MLLVTTSRKPCQKTRVLARTLANLIPESEYTTRGKASINTLIQVAQNKGYETICIIGEQHGNPNNLRFLKTFPEPSITKEITLSKIQAERIRSPTKTVQVTGKAKQEFKKLFNITQENPDAKTSINAEPRKWEFKKDDQLALTMEVTQ